MDTELQLNSKSNNNPEDIFHNNIYKLYKLIDKSSSLLWDHNNHITIGKKRKFDSEENFFNIETTQLGYGEISTSSMTQLFNFLMNIDTYLEQENDCLTESYNLNKNSYFLDIGSGFGKPVFHCAYQAGCICQGIEVVPARVEFCLDFYFSFVDGRNILNEKAKKKNNINFQNECFNGKRKKKSKKIKNKAKNSKDSHKNSCPQLKKYIDFNGFYKNTKNNFKYDWYNYCIFGYDFQINPIYSNFIWSVKSTKIHYDKNFFNNYIDNTLNENINTKTQPWVTSFSTKLKNEIINHNFLILTDNEINHYFEDPFPNIATKLIFDEKNLEFSEKIINNIAYNITNNLFGSYENEYLPTIDKEVNLNENILNNMYFLDFLKYIDVITSINYKNTVPLIKKNSIEKIETNYTESIHADTEENQSDTKTPDMKSTDNQSIPNIQKYLQNKLTFVPHNPEFYKLCSFLCNDATKYKDYHYISPFEIKDEKKQTFTHIYSYNKLMGDTCKEKICEILNKTDWKVLAWYTNERQTYQSGLENFQYVTSFSMTSTGNQKFSCYVYIKKYD